jgi:hypothetical protein
MRAAVAGTVGILCMIQGAGAMDVGNSVAVTTGKTAGVEVFYEKYKRDVTQDIAGTDDSFSNEQDENRIIARLKYSGIPTTLLTFDVGMTESKGSEGYVPMLGLGVSKDVYSQNDLTLSLFAKATYVTEIEYKDSETYYGRNYYLTYAETYENTRTETYWEYGGGFQLSKLWHLQGGAKLNTYGGVLASFINSDGEESVEYYGAARGRFTGNLYLDSDSAQESGVDFKEDKPVGVFLGIALGLPNSPFSIRAETRLIDQTSFSLGAGIAF